MKALIFKQTKTYRALAIKLLQEDKKTYDLLHNQPIWIKLQDKLNNSFDHLYIKYQTKNINDIFNDEKAAFAKGTITETVKFAKKNEKSLTEKLDSILIHKLFGLPIFLFLMWGLFQLTFEIGGIPMDIIDGFFCRFNK